MAETQKKKIYGIQGITAYDVDTRQPLGTAKIVGSASFALTGETVDLMGGASLFPWAVENGPISTEITLNIKEFPTWLYEAFLGKSVTEFSAEATASVDTLANAEGTSVLEATTGIASVGVKAGSEADVKTSNYVVKAVTATTVDVYALTDVDFSAGTDTVYVDDTMKITATPLTITTGAAVEIPDYGLELTGGSGTIGMTADDTAVFSARSINYGGYTVKVGGSTDTYREIGLILTSAKQSDGTVFYIDVFRAKGLGMPINMTEKEFSTAEIAIKGFRDEARDGICEITQSRTAA